jgi:hypothetical protein
VLGQTHRPERRRSGTTSVHLRRPAYGVGRNARDFLTHLERVRPDCRFDLLELTRPLADELGIRQSGIDDVVQHAVEQRHIGARGHLKMDVRQLGKLHPSNIGDNQLGTARNSSLDQRTEHRVGLGRIRTGDENDVARLLDLAHRPRCRGRVQCAIHGRDRRRVTQTGAVVYAVGAKRRAHHPHEGVVVLVAALGRREGAERLRAMLVPNSGNFLGGEAQCFVPGGLAEGAVPSCRRSDSIADVIFA